MHGEARSAAVVTDAQIESLQKLFNCYSPCNWYNMDKISWFYQMAPNKTITQWQIAGVKKQKPWLTIALIVNETRFF